jgi:aromatic-L-amino-acid/L-tryptophan decarboxylase
MDHPLFRKKAHEIADWMADYFESVQNYPVFPGIQPGEIKNKLPVNPPDQGEHMDAIFSDFENIILPGMTHWQHPGFMAYFPASRSAPSVLAEMITATLGAQCMLWYTSPAAEELEERMMEWLRKAIDVSDDFTGVIQEGASSSNLIALLMARERCSDYKVNKHGFYHHKPMRIYTSEQIHSSVNKAVRIAGFGEEHLVMIPTTTDYAMNTEILERLILRDLSFGYRPLAVVAAFGTTASTAIDPLQKIGQICQKYGLFFHVDAAYAGSAMILPEIRKLAKGIELADSFVFNPHKWLMTNFDCSAFYVKDTPLLKSTFDITPEYLRTPQDQNVNNYRDWGIQLGRRFRALKLWFVLRSYGIDGLKEMLQNHIDYARQLAEKIQHHPDFEILARVDFNLICFRFNPSGKTNTDLNELNKTLLKMINDSGKLFLTGTTLNGNYCLRLVAGNVDTTFSDLEKAWVEIQEKASYLT